MSEKKPFRRRSERNARSLIKALTYRIMCSTTTLVITFLIAGTSETAISVTLMDVVLKLFLFYFHERLWIRLDHRYWPGPTASNWRSSDTYRRTVIKAFTYRVLCTSTTLIVVLFVTGQASTALTIAGVDTVIKLFEYVAHERLWIWVDRRHIPRAAASAMAAPDAVAIASEDDILDGAVRHDVMVRAENDAFPRSAPS